MKFKKSPFSIFNKERGEMNYIRRVYKRRVQAEIDSYKDFEDKDVDTRDTIEGQDILILDRISI